MKEICCAGPRASAFGDDFGRQQGNHSREGGCQLDGNGGFKSAGNAGFGWDF